MNEWMDSTRTWATWLSQLGLGLRSTICEMSNLVIDSVKYALNTHYMPGIVQVLGIQWKQTTDPALRST